MSVYLSLSDFDYVCYPILAQRQGNASPTRTINALLYSPTRETPKPRAGTTYSEERRKEKEKCTKKMEGDGKRLRIPC